MDFEEAKDILTHCERRELKDHAFGDMEVTWMNGDQQVASGYFGGGMSEVSFLEAERAFTGEYARELLGCGTLVASERNDMTGPDEFVEGQVMPGLTKEGVLKELTNGN